MTNRSRELPRSRYRETVMHADLAAHEWYLIGLLVPSRGPYYADWSDGLRRTRAALANLARR